MVGRSATSTEDKDLTPTQNTKQQNQKLRASERRQFKPFVDNKSLNQGKRIGVGQ